MKYFIAKEGEGTSAAEAAAKQPIIKI